MSTNPKISIIAPVLNESETIYEFLKQFSNQTIPNAIFEIVLIDNGSIDGTYNLIKRYIKMNKQQRIRLVFEKRIGIAHATKKGFDQESLSEIVVKLDADSRVRRNFLANVYFHFRRYKDDDAIIGDLQFPWETILKFKPGQFKLYNRLLHKRRVLNQTVAKFYGPMLAGPFYAVRRSCYKKVGGISLRRSLLRYTDDIELTMKLILAGFHIRQTTIPVIISPRRMFENIIRYLTGEYYWGVKRPLFRHKVKTFKIELPDHLSLTNIEKRMVDAHTDLLLKLTAYSIIYGQTHKPYEAFLKALDSKLDMNALRSYNSPSKLYYGYLRQQRGLTITNYLLNTLRKNEDDI